MVRTYRCKKLCTRKEKPLDPEKPGGMERIDVDCSPSLLLNIALALQVSIFFKLHFFNKLIKSYETGVQLKHAL